MTPCENWLRNALRGKGWVECSRIREAAKKEGFTRNQLKEARRTLCILTDHDDRIGHDEWYWRYSA